MKGKILVIEDEPSINDLICMNLEAAGYEAEPFFDGLKVERHLEEKRDYELALLDVMLPGKDGFELLPVIQEARIPVIFLTAKGDLASKVRGLKYGAEDYLVKPFEMLELLVRIEKVLRRAESPRECIYIKNIAIYPKRRVVEKEGREVQFTPMEFDCLMLLLKNKNSAVTREELLAALWGVDFEGETRTIDVHIGRIRKKLDFGNVIRTIPRIGYRLEY